MIRELTTEWRMYARYFTDGKELFKSEEQTASPLDGGE